MNCTPKVGSVSNFWGAVQNCGAPLKVETFSLFAEKSH